MAASGRRFYQSGPLQYLIFGVRLQDCYGWGRPIFSAAPGVVVVSEDGLSERNPVHIARDLAIMFKNAWTFNPEKSFDFRYLGGNHIILETLDGYAVYAHAQTGSIKVSTGEKVLAGQHLANVGHSGNSTAPHLHFQLMDHQDPRHAQGILCCFREYEVFRDGVWQAVQNGIPKSSEPIRRL